MGARVTGMEATAAETRPSLYTACRMERTPKRNVSVSIRRKWSKGQHRKTAVVMQVKTKRVIASVIPQITIAAAIGTVVIAVALNQTNLITASVAATADASVLIKAASFLRA